MIQARFEHRPPSRAAFRTTRLKRVHPEVVEVMPEFGTDVPDPHAKTPHPRTARAGGHDNAKRQELPMAIADCALDPMALSEQADRYRRLGAAAQTIERRNDQAFITFDPTVDVELLRATIATERRCCPFLVLDYEESHRRLSITVADPSRLDAVEVVLSTLHAEPTPPAR